MQKHSKSRLLSFVKNVISPFFNMVKRVLHRYFSFLKRQLRLFVDKPSELMCYVLVNLINSFRSQVKPSLLGIIVFKFI